MLEPGIRFELTTYSLRVSGGAFRGSYEESAEALFYGILGSFSSGLVGTTLMRFGATVDHQWIKGTFKTRTGQSGKNTNCPIMSSESRWVARSDRSLTQTPTVTCS